MKHILKNLALFWVFFTFFAFFMQPNGYNVAVCNAEMEEQCKMAIIIDDFGGFERDGVEEMLSIDAPLTCAVMPFVENTNADYQEALAHNHEVILHMPMESHVNLPLAWYGPTFIRNYDSVDDAKVKLDACLSQVPLAKGVNIHIGSGVCRNEKLMEGIIGHLSSKGLFFCDSRTHIGTKCQEAALACHQPYLGRDVFLEPHGMKSYANACRFLLEGANIAKQKGYSVAIGHVGKEGGVQTARAIKDTLPQIEALGVKIVPLSEIYSQIQSQVV